MVLLQINVVANSGSTGRIAEGIGCSAIENGFKSYVAYGRWALPSQSELIKIGGKNDYLWHGVESRIFDNHGHASRRATADFLKTVEKISPDIIHLHNIHGYYLNYPMLFEFLAEAKVPVVWTLHDCWPFTGHCACYDCCGCNRWKTQCQHCPQKKTYPASFLFDRSEKNYADKKHFFTLPENMTIVPVSKWMASQVAESFLKDYPRKLIYNGIDTDVFRPYDQNEMKEQFGWQNKKILLGVASTWAQRKGLKDFISLSQELPYEYHIVLVGTNDKQKKNLPANITAISRTESTAELARLYSAADVFVNPTWEDNYPTTNLEAISCGTPVVTYRTGGSPESVKEGNGVIVDKGNLQQLKDALMQVRKNTESCRAYALQNFRMQDRFEEYIDLYNQLLKN